MFLWQSEKRRRKDRSTFTVNTTVFYTLRTHWDVLRKGGRKAYGWVSGWNGKMVSKKRCEDRGNKDGWRVRRWTEEDEDGYMHGFKGWMVRQVNCCHRGKGLSKSLLVKTISIVVFKLALSIFHSFIVWYFTCVGILLYSPWQCTAALF